MRPKFPFILENKVIIWKRRKGNQACNPTSGGDGGRGSGVQGHSEFKPGLQETLSPTHEAKKGEEYNNTKPRLPFSSPLRIRPSDPKPM